MRATLAVVVLCLLMACESFGSTVDAVSGTDAGADSSSQPPTDAARDGAAVPSDANTSGSSCMQSGAAWCQDFDGIPIGAKPMIAGWTPYLEGTGTYAVVTGGLSAPNALALEGTGTDWSELYATVMPVGVPSSSIDVDVYLYGSAAPTVWIQLTWFDSENFRRGLTLTIPSTGGTFREMAGRINAETPFATVSLMRGAWTMGWHHVRIDVDWTAKVASVEIDTTKAADLTLTGTLLERPFLVELGAHEFDAAPAPKRVLYDNLVARVR